MVVYEISRFEIQVVSIGITCHNMKGVGNFPKIVSKISFLRYSTGESVMIPGDRIIIFDRDHVSKFYFAVAQCHVTVSGNPRKFSEYSRISSESSGENLENFSTSRLPIYPGDELPGVKFRDCVVIITISAVCITAEAMITVSKICLGR